MKVINVIEYKIKEVKGGKMVGGRCDILLDGDIKEQWEKAKGPTPEAGQVVLQMLKRIKLNSVKSGFLKEGSI